MSRIDGMPCLRELLQHITNLAAKYQTVVVVETAVTSGFHIVDRTAYRLQPPTNNQERENRCKCSANERNCGKRDGNPGPRLSATLLREAQIVQQNKVTA